MSKPQVVIVRKDKRISHKILHAAAFAATGGVSGVVTAAEVANNAAYNARTRKLQAQEGQGSAPRNGKVGNIVTAVSLFIIMLVILIAIVVA